MTLAPSSGSGDGAAYRTYRRRPSQDLAHALLDPEHGAAAQLPLRRISHLPIIPAPTSAVPSYGALGASMRGLARQTSRDLCPGYARSRPPQSFLVGYLPPTRICEEGPLTGTQLFAGIFVVAIAALLIGRFELLCLRDLHEASDADLHYLTRSGWFAAIVLAIPIGGIAYLAYGRAR